ncbi:MAG: zf-HC2 domain-containing protein [Vicinamibacterales bacterium]
MLTHPGDDLLMLAREGALSRREQARVQAHLAGCPACQRRHEALDLAAAELMQAFRTASPVPTPASTGDARLRLEAALREEAARWEGSRWLRLRRSLVLQVRPLRMAAATAALALAVVWVSGAVRTPSSSGTAVRSGSAAAARSPLPVASLTPGAVASLTAAQLCAGTRPSRMVTETVRRQVLAGYGMEQTPPDTYELDALVTPELGGTTELANLWPQPYHSPVWNAHVKDALEELFAGAVCADQMPLQQAQQEIAADWVAAYQRHFRTATPIPAHAQATEADEELLYEVPRLVELTARLFVQGRPARP